MMAAKLIEASHLFRHFLIALAVFYFEMMSVFFFKYFLCWPKVLLQESFQFPITKRA
jgi:hypothetical protein